MSLFNYDPGDLDLSVGACFEKVVNRFSNRLALKGQDDEYSYAELNCAANRVAFAILNAIGSSTEPVALLAEQGSPAIAAILGIIKAGKFHVPLDASFPVDRLELIMADAGARLLVTNRRNLGLAKQLARGDVSILTMEELPAALSDKNPGIPFEADALINIMYTSGTTGRPKGVTQSHRSVVHTALRALEPGTDERDRIALFTSHSIGSSAAFAFNALLHGAALLPFDLKAASMRTLADWLARESITDFYVVPSVFRALVSVLEPGQVFHQMRVLRMGAEPAFKQDVVLFNEHFPADSCLVVTLGSSETLGMATNVLAHGDRIDEAVVPVGWASTDSELVILDEARQPVPWGEVGDIWFKSRYMSPGYWHRPDLTEAAFTQIPGSDLSLYRTGDLGRFNAEGKLEHLGRRDMQFKVRGKQVILSDVEQALRELENVREAVAVGRHDPRGELRLVAYLSPDHAPAPAASELRTALTARLPEFMVPYVFVTLDKLPRLPNNKLDLRALPEPEWTARGMDGNYVAPRTPLEEMLAGIWSDVLGLERVGVQDNFLELGGDSLRASQIVARAMNQCHVELSPTELLDVMTVAGLARVIARHMAEQVDRDKLEEMLSLLENS